MDYKTEQEKFWAGEFGTQYIQRNAGDELLASNLMFFSKALVRAQEVSSCIEFGANIGMNMKALKLLYPKQEQHAIEINQDAVAKLAQVVAKENIYQASILEFSPGRTWDIALIKGVLIHINPEFLTAVYDTLYGVSNRYILVCEYYNPSPVAIPYRGHEDRLFKRDFCGDLMDRYTDLALIDYGFAYHRDPGFPQDDITWFLLEKVG